MGGVRNLWNEEGEVGKREKVMEKDKNLLERRDEDENKSS